MLLNDQIQLVYISWLLCQFLYSTNNQTILFSYLVPSYLLRISQSFTLFKFVSRIDCSVHFTHFYKQKSEDAFCVALKILVHYVAVIHAMHNANKPHQNEAGRYRGR